MKGRRAMRRSYRGCRKRGGRSAATRASTFAGAQTMPTPSANTRPSCWLTPDVIVASGSLSVTAFQRLTRTVPIVFAAINDPVGVGFVDSLARPGGSITGFMNFEYSFSGKWLELLKEIAPGLRRAAILRDTSNPAAIGQLS